MMNKGHDIAMALRAAYLSMHRQTNAYLAAVGITADQFVCLALLAVEDGITQQELVRRANSDPNTIRAMLMILEKRGLVKREKHPTDGRARHVTLTARGRTAYRRSMEQVREVQDLLKAQIPSGAEKIVMKYFENILAHLSA